MSSSTKYIIGAVVLALVVIGGCNFIMHKTGEVMVEKMIEGAGGGKVDVDANGDGTMTFKNDEGTMTTGNTVPEDWPKDVPVYPGATVQFSGSANPATGKSGIAMMMVTEDTTTKVVDYYKAGLKDNGWAIMNTMQVEGASMLIATKDGHTMSATIGDSNGKTSITLGVETGTK